MRNFKKKIAFLSVLFILAGCFVPIHVKAETTAKPDYKVYVNKAISAVLVKQINENAEETLVKIMTCSCGGEGNETPEGTFSTYALYRWRPLFGNVYGQYVTRFNNHILFHSVPYSTQSPDSLDWEAYNLLGQNVSHGCVRLSVSDAKWIYDNCKKGTKVVVYTDPTEIEKVPIPATYKLDGQMEYKNWDPTDTDARNPWTPILAQMNSQNIESLDNFNYVAYADTYPDLREIYGYNAEALYTHYMTLGKNENRVADFTRNTAIK